MLLLLLTGSCLFTSPSLGASAAEAACPDSEWKDVGFLGFGFPPLQLFI